MDMRTGKIKNLSQSDVEKMRDEFKNIVSFKTEDLTKKQEKNMKVSKHDNKSKLGKIYTDGRKLKYNEMTKNQKRNFRKKHGLR